MGNYAKVVGLCELLRNAVVSRTFRFNRICQYRALVSPARKWSFFSDGCEKGSSVYEHALKFQRPSPITYTRALENSVSLIGTVIYPLKQVNNQGDRLGFHTMLKVKANARPDQDFKILLKMWDFLAEECLTHLKEDDFIYVNGRLQSYAKAAEDGSCSMYYEVDVKEINYVARDIGGKTFRPTEKSHLLGVSGEDDMEKYRNRLHLWQVFLANPYEWTDLRKSKRNPKQPDFKHRSTGEALWLNSGDPPWLKRQLQRLDSAMADQCPEGHGPYLADRFW